MVVQHHNQNIELEDGIADVVLYLWDNNVTTTMSCEGHLDWGLPYPWVMIENKKSIAIVHNLIKNNYELELQNIDGTPYIDGYHYYIARLKTVGEVSLEEARICMKSIKE